jgi:glycosyltransferase involved in cell wall biosynthesis
MKKKKILHITYDMRIGGTEMVIKNIIEGSDPAKYEMSIFCIEQPIGPWGDELQENGTAIYSQNRKEGFDFTLISAIRELLKSENIDVIHCHQYTPWVYGSIASVGLRTKVIFTEHGRFYPDSSSWKRKVINPILSFFTEHITAISKATKKALVDYEFLSVDKIMVIYNGIKALPEADEIEKRNLKRELLIEDYDIVLGTVARLDPIKNHEMMVNAFSEIIVKNPNVKLIIVGDGDLLTNLKEQCSKLNIVDKVIFTGYIVKPSIYIHIFDIFLLPSFSEGTSMTLLEALSAGKPCIVTDAGGNAEIICNGSNGIVTENDNLDEFTDALLDLLTRTDKREAMGQAGLIRYEQNFSQFEMSSKYECLYDFVDFES